jgi:hypothetical protein
VHQARTTLLEGTIRHILLLRVNNHHNTQGPRTGGRTQPTMQHCACPIIAQQQLGVSMSQRQAWSIPLSSGRISFSFSLSPG